MHNKHFSQLNLIHYKNDKIISKFYLQTHNKTMMRTTKITVVGT